TVKLRMFDERKKLSELLEAQGVVGALSELTEPRASSRSIEFGTLDGDGSELVGGNHVHAPAFEPNPTALGPRPQLFVGALARYADHLTDLALRDGRLSWGGGPIFGRGQLQQGLRQPGRQIQKRDVLHLLAGPAQT